MSDVRLGDNGVRLRGEIVVPGEASGVLLASSEPLSFWGGYDQKSGEIIDRRHPLSGVDGTHSILAIPFTRGSSTTTAVLLESIRAGVAPAALITTGADTFLTLASVVADELYKKPLPIVSLSDDDFDALLQFYRTGDPNVRVSIDKKGNVALE